MSLRKPVENASQSWCRDITARSPLRRPMEPVHPAVGIAQTIERGLLLNAFPGERKGQAVDVLGRQRSGFDYGTGG